MRILDSAGVTPKWDDEQKAWYAMWESRGVFRHAWIEDARAFMAKLELVRGFGMRGYSVWLLRMEDPRVWGELRAADGRR
jgi:spore germination protein YaaH